MLLLRVLVRVSKCSLCGSVAAVGVFLGGKSLFCIDANYLPLNKTVGLCLEWRIC